MIRRLSWTVGACSAVLFLRLAWPAFFRLIFPVGNIRTFHVPMRHIYQQALHGGDSVLWTSSLFAGIYLHREGQLGAFHPLYQMVKAAEDWGRAQGCTEFASDALLDNDVSAAAHRALGFDETVQIRCFRKHL